MVDLFICLLDIVFCFWFDVLFDCLFGYRFALRLDSVVDIDCCFMFCVVSYLVAGLLLFTDGMRLVLLVYWLRLNA